MRTHRLMGDHLDTTQLPAYFLRRPLPPPDPELADSFERLFAEAMERGGGAEIEYSLGAPKWQFLCYLCDTGRALVEAGAVLDSDYMASRKLGNL